MAGSTAPRRAEVVMLLMVMAIVPSIGTANDHGDDIKKLANQMGSASQRTNKSEAALPSQKVEDDNFTSSNFSLHSTGPSVSENELFPNSFPGNKVKHKSPSRMGSADEEPSGVLKEHNLPSPPSAGKEMDHSNRDSTNSTEEEESHSSQHPEGEVFSSRVGQFSDLASLGGDTRASLLAQLRLQSTLDLLPEDVLDVMASQGVKSAITPLVSTVNINDLPPSLISVAIDQQQLDPGSVPTSTDGRLLTPTDVTRLEQLRSCLRHSDTSYNDHDTVLDALSLYDLYGNLNHGASLGINRNDILNIRPEPPVEVKDDTATSLATRQDAPPAAVTRFTPGLVTAFNTFFSAIATAVGNLITAIGTEFANNPALSLLALALAAYLLAHLFLSQGYGSGYGSGYGFTFFKPTKQKHKVESHGYGGGGGYKDEWRRNDSGAYLHLNGEIADPYTEAENVQRLMHLVDEYKARYGDLDVDIL